MNIEDIIEFCDPVSVHGKTSGPAGALHLDSRNISDGDIFIAVKGTQTDGHLFIENAIEKGAETVIIDQEQEFSGDVTVIQVKDTRALLSPLAQKLAGNPAKKLRIIGITGTNGKTTVATLVWQLLRSMGQNTGLLGTVSKKINDRDLESRLTTADPVELASDMKLMVENNCEYLVMEVSSHALHQKRVHGIPFEVAAFTNLTLDHLDYHKNMEEYARAKKILFDELSETSWAVVNFDDPKGEWIIKDTRAKILDFSLRKQALVTIQVQQTSALGTRMKVAGIDVQTPLTGLFNVYNAAEAMLICTALGFDGKLVAENLSRCSGAPGRMEKVTSPEKADRQPVVIVDYAHTPDALENVASTLAELKKPGQDLVIIFGCGGDRDKSKRPEMAKIAETYGDRVVVTSDNPRTENPDEIIKDILKGFSDDFSPQPVTSRKEAIQKTVLESSVNDIILIAGKGHETYQETDGKRIHFDDREIARKALSERNGHLNHEVH
ncbi:MAG: UDP-N-acetylmuramoyl-L-alanyl-D-glutamate--2,6-diaminopimelate ligase [Balneolaceae bacterium]